jgi:hypothetical protein
MWTNSVIVKRLSNLNNRTIGENLPNLVTLLFTLGSFVLRYMSSSSFELLFNTV